MATTHFASMPNVSLPRTKMGVSFTHPMSFKHGEVCPVFWSFCQPGDSFKLDFSMLLRMSQPIFPFFGDVDLYAHSFFVPLRLIYEDTAKFFGENEASAGPQAGEYLIPQGKCYYKLNGVTYAPAVGSVSHHLGMPAILGPDGSTLISDKYDPDIISAAGDAIPKYSVLPERAYWLIINEYYRAQQVENPVLIDKSSRGGILVSDTKTSPTLQTNPCWSRMPWITNKKLDYFTSATISPQYSADPVTLPLGEYAKLTTLPYDQIYDISEDSTKPNPVFGSKESFEDGQGYNMSLNVSHGIKTDGAYTSSPYMFGEDILPSADISVDSTNIVADLSSAVAANVNQIRLAFATQRFLERDNFGTRYPEIIKSHFGVTSSLSILQRPQLLYKGTTAINVQQVLSTAGASNTSSTTLGQPGANSVTAYKCPIVHNAFDEFGILMVLIETKHNRVYSQGVNRFRMKKTKFDFYFPEFATIGDQEIKGREVYALNNTDDQVFGESDVFGYQEAWAEYRYFPSIISGLMDPATEQGFGYMTLGEDFYERALDDLVYSESFLKEDRDALARCLVTGENGPDYFGDFAITGTMIRTMPLYSIPGLVDHVGGR